MLGLGRKWRGEWAGVCRGSTLGRTRCDGRGGGCTCSKHCRGSLLANTRFFRDGVCQLGLADGHRGGNRQAAVIHLRDASHRGARRRALKGRRQREEKHENEASVRHLRRGLLDNADGWRVRFDDR